MKIVEKLMNKKTLLTIGGIALIAGGVVLKNKQKPKFEQIKKDYRNNMELIDSCAKDLPEEEYSEQDRTQDMVSVYSRTVINTLKVMGPAYSFIVIGGCMITNAIIKQNINKEGMVTQYEI